jgi:hypothetical protein
MLGVAVTAVAVTVARAMTPRELQGIAPGRMMRMIARAHRTAVHVVAHGARSRIVRALNLFGRAARRRYDGRTAAARGVFFLHGTTWRSRIG